MFILKMHNLIKSLIILFVFVLLHSAVHIPWLWRTDTYMSVHNVGNIYNNLHSFVEHDDDRAAKPVGMYKTPDE